MPHINFEVKARTARQADIRAWLREQNADFKGVDFQTDTYFHVLHGRLKLREGNIENSLIQYFRADDPTARISDVALAPVADPTALKNALTRALGVKTEVRKRREIYFLGNVKIHLDELAGLGQFVEIEAIAPNPDMPVAELEAQCRQLMAAFQIQPEDVLAVSYSDMVLSGMRNEG